MAGSFQFPTMDPHHYGQNWVPNVSRVKDLGGFISQELGDLNEISQGLKSLAQNVNFPIKAFAGSSDFGFGTFKSQGGSANFGSFLKFNLLAGVVPTLQETSPATTGTLSAVSNLTYAASKLGVSVSSFSAAADLALTDGLGNTLESTQRLLISTANTIKASAALAGESGLLDTESNLNATAENLFATARSLTNGGASYDVAETLAIASDLVKQSNNIMTATSNQLTDIGHLISGITALNSSLGETLSQSWNVLNSTIGNSLISGAFSIVGRLVTGDSGVGSLGSAFVSQMLANAGVPPLETTSPKAYQSYGRPVDFHDPRNLRVNDMIILKSRSGIYNMGFLKSYNPQTKILSLMAGGGGGVSLAAGIKFSMTNPTLYITHVRRNWPPAKEPDLPISATPSGSGE